MLQLRALHRSTAVPVVGHEGRLPAVQDLPQILELIEAHGAGHVPLRQHSPSRTHHLLYGSSYFSIFTRLLLGQMSLCSLFTRG